jgi:TonB family protein
MTIAIDRGQKIFQSALLASIAVHIGLIILIAAAPSLPKSSKKGMVHYVTFNLGSLPGGGGAGGSGGRGGKKAEVPPPPKKETLKDLTVPQKLQPEPKSSLRHPVEKPKKEDKPKQAKKAAITKPPANLSDTKTQKPADKEGTDAGQGSGSGTGLKIGGLGSGPGGTGSGSGLADQIGLSNFPFQYYLQIIMDRVSASWFTSLVAPGVSGDFQTTVFFKIYRNGGISNLKVEETSGIQSLDMSALRAIQNASPFPPLPKEYEDEFLGIHLIFEHSK